MRKTSILPNSVSIKSRCGSCGKSYEKRLRRTKKYKQSLFYCQEYLGPLPPQKRNAAFFARRCLHSRRRDSLSLLISPLLVIRLNFLGRRMRFDGFPCRCRFFFWMGLKDLRVDFNVFLENLRRSGVFENRRPRALRFAGGAVDAFFGLHKQLFAGGLGIHQVGT